MELLDGIAEPAPPPSSTPAGGARRWLAGLVVATVAVALLVMWGPPGGGPQVGELATGVIVRFGDPFALDWVTLDHVDGADGSPEAGTHHARPMASIDPACFGFARLDWLTGHENPTVAYCLDETTVSAQAGASSITVVRKIPAGHDTWYFLQFGRPVAAFEARIGGDAPGDGEEPLHGDRINLAGRQAGLRVPTGIRAILIEWTASGAGSYRCQIVDAGEPAEQC